MISRRGLLATGAAAGALAACGRADDPPPGLFAGALADWAREIAQDDPERATSAGLGPDIAGEGVHARLTDRSALAMERRRAAALRRLVQLRAVDRATLSAADAVTFDILKEVFEANAACAEFSFGRIAIGGLRPYTLNALDSAFSTLPGFFDSTQPLRRFADADDYLARLRQVADALDAEAARARADAEAGVVPPDFVIDRALALVDSILAAPPETSPYVDALRRGLGALGLTQAADQARAQRAIAAATALVRDEIYPAYRRTHQALREMRPRATHDAGVWRLDQGDAFYRAALRTETTTAMAPDAIHEMGLDRVRRLSAELDIALRQLGMTEGPIGARLAQLTADPRHRYPDDEAGRAQLLADVRARIDRAMTAAPRWFTAMPRAQLEVRAVPAYLQASRPGAYYDAPALDGSRPGIYYVNLRAMGEMTKIDLPTQDYHEAAPGHHFQIALAQQQTQLPLIRRLLGFNAYTEGWALYAEQLIEESGFYDQDRIGRIGYLRWQMWRAARLVVDTGLHHKRWTREEAIAYLASVTGDAAGVIVTEVERYCIWPGQACGYEIGRAEIARMRDVARNRLGVAFDLRAFHDVILNNGETPLVVLDQLVRAWIDGRA